ncbi:MAG: hypothetical protein P8Y02_13140 [Deinococcales bacterium]
MIGWPASLWPTPLERTGTSDARPVLVSCGGHVDVPTLREYRQIFDGA